MLKAKDIMTRDVVTIRGSATVAEAIKIMKEKGLRALIVERRTVEDPYGIVTETDIIYKVAAYGNDPKTVRVFEIMNKPCIVLNPDLGVEYAARLLTQANLHSAPVIQSELLGILSISDILNSSHYIEQPREKELAQQIQQLSEDAYRICRENGPGSPYCADAWAKVDSLQADYAHQSNTLLHEMASEMFWDEYPEAFKDREYEAWCSG